MKKEHGRETKRGVRCGNVQQIALIMLFMAHTFVVVCDLLLPDACGVCVDALTCLYKQQLYREILRAARAQAYALIYRKAQAVTEG